MLETISNATFTCLANLDKYPQTQAFEHGFGLASVSLQVLVADPGKSRFLNTDQKKFAASACDLRAFTHWLTRV